MRQLTASFRIIFTYVLLILIVPVSVHANDSKQLQFDLQGDAHYSRYNFTDIKKPYKGTDGWAELKLTLWLDEKRSFSPYLSIIPSFTTEDEFWWQDNIQSGVGFQWYPVLTFRESKQKGFFDNIRLFALYAGRKYYDKPNDAEPEENDLRFGLDYYYDNLFDEKNNASFLDNVGMILWTNAGFRKTNFSNEQYKALLWTGNVKVGGNIKAYESILFPYVLADWCYVPKYQERWWENSFKVGAGIRIYPKTNNTGGFLNDFMKRFHVYIEVLQNADWLGDDPSAEVEETDFRIGLGFSTGGFYGEN